MNNRREHLWVGLFVVVAASTLVAVVLTVSGAFNSKGRHYRAYFKNVGGISVAAPVRYGGLLCGKVQRLRIDPDDPTRIEVEFRVGLDTPIKVDSVASITTLGALGENYLEITTGSKESPPAAPGSVLRSHETMAIAELGDLIGGLAPMAAQALRSLNDRLGEMQVTVKQVNELLGDRNRNNIGSSLETLHTILADARPKLSATLASMQAASSGLPAVTKNVEVATERLTPLLNDFKMTIKQANEALAQVDAIVGENRSDIRASMLTTRRTLESASKAVELLRDTLDRNGDNLDETLANLRATTDNLKDVTDTLKRKPSVLIRGETGTDRRPGGTR